MFSFLYFYLAYLYLLLSSLSQLFLAILQILAFPSLKLEHFHLKNVSELMAFSLSLKRIKKLVFEKLKRPFFPFLETSRRFFSFQEAQNQAEVLLSSDQRVIYFLVAAEKGILL